MTEKKSPSTSSNKRAQSGRLLSSSTTFSGFTLLSRLLGLVRDVLIALMLGAGSSADAFFVAFKVPNFLRRLFAEGAFSQAFVPVMSEYKPKGMVEVRQMLQPVFGALGGMTALLSVLAIIGAPFIVWVVAPGFSDMPDKMALTADMLQITFPYLFFVSTMACAGGVLNTYGIFGPSAFSPVILNLCMIAALIFAAPLMQTPAMTLAYAVAFAGLFQLLLHLFYLRRIDLFVFPNVNFKHPGLRKILVLMTPAIFGVSVSQINLLLDTVLASFLKDGSVSWLYYADRLIELPLGVFGIAISTVILPHLSSQHVAQSTASFSKTLDWGVRWVVLLGLPSAMAFVVLAEPILMTLFLYGEFTPNDVAQSSAALRAYSLALLPFMLIKVLATGYFSRQDTKTPVKIGIIAMLVNMVANLALVGFLAHVGLALATALSAALNGFLLYRGLERNNVYSISNETGAFCIRVLLAGVSMVVVLFLLDVPRIDWVEWVFYERVVLLFGTILVGFVVFLLSALVVGVRLTDLREPAHDSA